ncbi:MAG TPA: hypothetical protein VJ551_02790 [Nitrososphaeraceae archaeon]|jgi:hypothetical protein|nr:hypothetical protein [Nitrososphaeraceae archaeon]
MSSKDEFLFKKSALMGTKSGKEILKQGILREKGYKQFYKYNSNIEDRFQDFTKRFLLSLHTQVISDPNPAVTMKKFVEETGSAELALEDNKISDIRTRLSKPELLADRVNRILNSNFVKMTFPVLDALFDAASLYYKQNVPTETKNAIVDGHLIAIDLSEPMDRIIDRDEDLEYLDDYRLMNPYILEIAREKISHGGNNMLRSFEEGFRDARIGQSIDAKLKMKPDSINDENMNGCYKKYRAIMGTAGRNMALNMKPLSEIFSFGMAKAGESVGCGNEIQDAIKNGSIKTPSWPLYFFVATNDVRKSFELTMKKSEAYHNEAKLSLDMLPHDFEYKPFLEFLFLTVSHYNQYWYNDLNRRDLYPLLRKNLSLPLKM